MTKTTSKPAETVSVAPDWDPAPPDREWYRNTSTGDRGYRVRRGGQDLIRLDRPMQELVSGLTDAWKPDEYGSLFLPEQIARVAFMADRGVCSLVGLHQESRVTWADISDKDRTEFIRLGPKATAHPARKLVHAAIFAAMKPFTRA